MRRVESFEEPIVYSAVPGPYVFIQSLFILKTKERFHFQGSGTNRSVPALETCSAGTIRWIYISANFTSACNLTRCGCQGCSVYCLEQVHQSGDLTSERTVFLKREANAGE